MKRMIAVIFALLCAGTAQAETDMSQYKPSLYCGIIPEGRVIVERNGRRETAGKRFRYSVKGQVVKFEERYITTQGEKCAVKAFALVAGFGHKEDEVGMYFNPDKTKKDRILFMNIPIMEDINNLLRGPSYPECYRLSVDEFFDEKIENESCYELAEKYAQSLEDKLKILSICGNENVHNFNQRGFVGYYFIPSGNEISCGENIYGFYYFDGKINTLKSFYDFTSYTIYETE